VEHLGASGNIDLALVDRLRNGEPEVLGVLEIADRTSIKYRPYGRVEAQLNGEGSTASTPGR
jgi:hypothetical protein